jgi:hypothetical protein
MGAALGATAARLHPGHLSVSAVVAVVILVGLGYGTLAWRRRRSPGRPDEPAEKPRRRPEELEREPTPGGVGPEASPRDPSTDPQGDDR